MLVCRSLPIPPQSSHEEEEITGGHLLQLLGFPSSPLLCPDGLISVIFELHPADCVTLGHPTMQACQCGSDHHGENPVYHSGFQTTGFTRCALRDPTSPMGCIHQFFCCAFQVNSLSTISPRYWTSVTRSNMCPERAGSLRMMKTKKMQ